MSEVFGVTPWVDGAVSTGPLSELEQDRLDVAARKGRLLRLCTAPSPAGIDCVHGADRPESYRPPAGFRQRLPVGPAYISSSAITPRGVFAAWDAVGRVPGARALNPYKRSHVPRGCRCSDTSRAWGRRVWVCDMGQAKIRRSNVITVPAATGTTPDHVSGTVDSDVVFRRLWLVTATACRALSSQPGCTALPITRA